MFINKNLFQSSMDAAFELACKKWESNIVPYYKGKSDDFVNICRDIYKPIDAYENLSYIN